MSFHVSRSPNPSPIIGEQTRTLEHLLKRCEDASARPADWLGIAARLLPHDPRAAACAASVAFEQQPELLRHAAHNRSLAAAMQLVVEDRRRRTQKFVDQAADEGADPNALNMLKAELGLAPPMPPEETRRPFQSYYPGLGRAPWVDQDQLPWAEQLLNQREHILMEWQRYRSADGSMRPYVSGFRYDGAMQQLHNSDRWSTVHLVDSGRMRATVAHYFSATLAALSQVPQVEIPRQSPEVFFSVLAPDTHIPPHFGQANWKLTVHLGLEVPEGCSITVDGEERFSHPGALLAFDDSYRHEAINRSDLPRTHLVFEVWHPGVPESGRWVISALHRERGQWRAHRKQRSLELARQLLA